MSTTDPRPVEFRGSSLDELRAFPLPARREAGHQLDQVQNGQEPDDWKPMNTVGQGAPCMLLSWLLVHLGEGGKEWLEGGQENRGINAREVFSLAFMPRKPLDAL
jgi:hypothetical protein